MPAAYWIEYGIRKSEEKIGPETVWKHSTAVGNVQVKALDSILARIAGSIGSNVPKRMNPDEDVALSLKLPSWLPGNNALLSEPLPRNNSAPGLPRSARSKSRNS